MSKIINDFLRLRREIRRHQELNMRIYWAVRRARREVTILKKGTVFEQARAKTITTRADTLDEVWHNGNLRTRELGQQLLAMAPEFDAATAFEQRLDLINVNVADRAAIDPGAGLVILVAGHCVEDSAERRGEHHQSGVMYSTVQLEIIVWLSSTAEGRAAGESALTKRFRSQTFHMLDLKPKLQLVSASTTPPTTERN